MLECAVAAASSALFCAQDEGEADQNAGEPEAFGGREGLSGGGHGKYEGRDGLKQRERHARTCRNPREAGRKKQIGEAGGEDAELETGQEVRAGKDRRA